MRRFLVPCLLLIALFAGLTVTAPAAPPEYVKKANREETVLAILNKAQLPSLQGGWMWVGPFDNAEDAGFDREFPPEKETIFDPARKYVGRGNAEVKWAEYKNFAMGKTHNLALFPQTDHTLVYLHHTIDNPTPEPILMPLNLGSDDTISVWLNGKRILHEGGARPCAPYQNRTELKLVPGKNELLLKVCNVAGGFEVWVMPGLPKGFPDAIKRQLDKDFAELSAKSPTSSAKSAEEKHYKMTTLPQPDDCVLEVGGMAFRPDGKLMACTRRGEVWTIENPTSDDLSKVKFTRFATGLHEALGLIVDDNKSVVVAQRPELTRLTDNGGTGRADEFVTLCDKWGSSGDYHEFVFGPARDKDGNMFLTLNVGFGFGDQGKAPWRGWCIKITPKGELIPWASGLRSPNGINFSPDGELFYCDNQGEWAASNKMHQILPGEFYGHQASLRWIKDSPYAGTLADKVLSGMFYDGQKAKQGGPEGMPKLTPPVVWFPYGRMGQSATEPRWDTTGGKFGPFAGQCFVGDMTKSVVMRVALEKVNGRNQGACFPFRSGFQSGVNRIAFAPDGSLFAGQTNRGWGGVGGKSYGLQRLAYTGVLPFEIYSMKITKTGFDLTFTKPVGLEVAAKAASYNLKSFTYTYFSNYGCPEMDTRAEKVTDVKISANRMTVSLTVPNLRVGRVYDLSADGVRDSDNEPLLHNEAYYTLNHLKD